MKLDGKILRNILIFLAIVTAIYFVISAGKYTGIENFDSSSKKVDTNWTLILIVTIPVTIYLIIGLVLLARGSGSAPRKASAPMANSGNNNSSSVNSDRTSDPGINLGALASKVNLGGIASSVSGMSRNLERLQQAQRVGSAVGRVGSAVGRVGSKASSAVRSVASKASGAAKSVGKGISSGYSKVKGYFS